jgi:3-phenylpropionate/cinnamic acid dioxygenase small subunit
MTVCSNTGISVPECSCRACLQAQIERHMPSLLNADTADGTPTVEMAAISTLSRLRFGRRLRRLRRAA